MRHPDLQPLIAGLTQTDVYLPHHQRVLRAYLLASYVSSGWNHIRNYRAVAHMHQRSQEAMPSAQRSLTAGYYPIKTQETTMIILGQLDTKPHYITLEGMTELRAHLESLKRAHATLISEMQELASQSSAGALEDSARTLNHDRAIELSNQILSIEHIICTAKLIKKPTSKTRVQIGSKVVVDIDGVKKTYTIVGPLETDPYNGKISNESPIGQYLLGKKVHDHFRLTALDKHSPVVTILAIE